MNSILEIPTSFLDFHNEELVHSAGASLAAEAFSTWLMKGNPPPANHESIGYVVPPVLGGADDFSNLKKTDMEMDWKVYAQLLASVGQKGQDDEPKNSSVDDLLK